MEYIVPVLLLLGGLFYLFNRSSFPRKAHWRAPKNAELVRTLLNLEEESLEQLFALYKQQFGEGAARYARKTYQKWKSGKVRPNNQTFRRFLINLPKVMSFDLKCEVLRELRANYGANDQYSLSVNTTDWKEKLMPLVDSIIAKGEDVELPLELQRKLSWLAEDDAQLADALLDKLQREESLNVRGMLDKEFLSIEKIIVSAGRRGKVTHTVKLPYGTIVLKIKRS